MVNPRSDRRTVASVSSYPEKLPGLFSLADPGHFSIAPGVERGKLRVKTANTRSFLDAIVQTPGLSVLEISAEIAFLSTQFSPPFPGDPADRIIAATARAHGLPLVTRDERLQESPLLRTIW